MRLLTLLILLLPAQAPAESAQATFDIYVSGVRAGMIAVASEERDGRYAVAGRLESAGVVGIFRNVRYDAEVRGRAAGVEFRPKRYAETFRNGGDTETKSITYRQGVPSVRSDDNPDSEDLDPATQGGTVDPLTAIWGVLRDVSEAEVCRFSAPMFDGARRSRITLGSPRRGGGEITCAGEYRRVAGYDADDMEDPRFPFHVTYGPAGNGRWRVERIDMETVVGRGAMVRR